jgi:alpha-N-arabinofuranosidase
MIAQNPILRGFYPDPSVCRVGKDFYLVNSTFSYVPGVPVFHSRDLVNWVQIGNVLERESQLPLNKAEMSRGIFAPTIRHHNGVFYMITTNVDDGGNFYVTATDPAGPWSDPIWLKVPEGQDGGIDPSLFFEGDKCYYVGQRQKPDAKFYGDCEVWIQELDLENGELIGEVTSLYSGSMKECVWVEGPHLYHIGDYYYITCAEMGTCFEHSISVARSKNLLGPYENFKCNPLLTHRHLGKKSAIQNIGHGDLVDTEDGQWYLIMLGTRPIDGITELGRETFIAEVSGKTDGLS